LQEFQATGSERSEHPATDDKLRLTSLACMLPKRFGDRQRAKRASGDRRPNSA